MKKMMTLAVMMTIAVAAHAMNYSTARAEALFLSDKMAYELGLTDAQYNAVYEINLDYLLCVNTPADAYGSWWNRRNADLQYVLSASQYARFLRLAHFHRPLTWRSGGWHFGVYTVYNRGHFYKGRPVGFASYRGGNNQRHGHYASHRPAPVKPTHHAGATHHSKPTVNSHGSSHRKDTRSHGHRR
jgi:hypothetical protein